MVASASPAAGVIVARCDSTLAQALDENRRIAHNLHPGILDALGLAAACSTVGDELQSRAKVEVKSSVTGLGKRLPADVELNLFRIVQEAFMNVEKHAHARTVQLRLAVEKDSIQLKVQDDGRGFDLKASQNRKRRGLGLANIRERVLSLGGTCRIMSAPGRGTTITVHVPIEDAR